MHHKIYRTTSFFLVCVLLAAALCGCAPRTPSPAESSASQSTTAQSESTLPPATTQAPPETTEASAPPEETTAPEPVSDKYFDDALFIGDSRVEGLQLYGNIKNATYYTAKGLTVTELLTKPFVKTPDGKKTLEAMLTAHKFGKIYIKLGVNELGWPYPEKFAEAYGKLLDKVIELEPDALIYVQSILPVTAKKAADGNVYTNKKVDLFNERINELCRERGLVYLNVREAVMDENGALPEDAAADGIHLNKKYCALWCDYLRTHTEQ